MKPHVIKHPISSSKGYITPKNKYLYFVYCSIWFFILPGFLGQGLLYWLVWKRNKRLWELIYHFINSLF